MWTAHIDSGRLIQGAAVYARAADGTMRHLCEVGHRCVFGGLMGDDAPTSSARFTLDDDEHVVQVYRLIGRPLPPELPLNDEPDFAAIIADREHAAL